MMAVSPLNLIVALMLAQIAGVQRRRKALLRAAEGEAILRNRVISAISTLQQP